MLAFLTLLLGIVAGPREVELSVPDGTAAVEVLLDGERVGVRRAAPWTFVVDFGAVPAPHHLDAVARDANGSAIGRTRQRVNVPRPEVEAALALVPGKGGTGRVARLAWEGAVGAVPSRVTVSFDGRPLAAPDLARIELPPFVPERLHFLRAAVEFERGARAEAEITLGGRDRDETSGELTAVPLRAPGGRLPSPEAMADWLTAGGAPLRVVASEKGEGSIVFVLDADGPAAFRELRDRSILPSKAGVFHGEPEVRMLLAYGTTEQGAQAAYDVFPRSFPAYLRNGLLHALAEVYVPWDGLSCPRLSDAVTAAGVLAAAWSHPRAVVVVLTGNPDVSILSAEAARSYLSDLGVPLVVWIAGSGAPVAALGWGGGVEVKSRGALRAAVRSLETALDEQSIVWVEGAHLPQSVAVSAKAPPGIAVAR